MPTSDRYDWFENDRAGQPSDARTVERLRTPTAGHRRRTTGVVCALASGLMLCLLLAAAAPGKAGADTLHNMPGLVTAKNETLVAGQKEQARNAANYKVVLGTLSKPDRTFYQYGEYLIRDERSGRFYAIGGRSEMLDRYVGERVLVFGRERARYSDGAVEGGPPLIAPSFAIPIGAFAAR